MKPQLAAFAQSLKAGARRTGAAIRRHPFLTAALLPLLAVLYVLALIPFTPSIGDLQKVKQEQPSIVMSADGKELAVFKRANRDWVKLKDISPNVIDALIATEDRRFFQHQGIDFARTAKALVATAGGDRQGGSTITQQLARNLYPEQIGRAPTITRKLKEAITALKIEAIYSKDEILETYLNSVSFLYNAWGIEMASRTYFDKPSRKLDALEAATLVGMLKGTSYYNPVLNPERALERRNLVLAQMARHKKLPEAQLAALQKQPLKLDFERQPEILGPAPHLTEQLRRWLLEWADKHDYNIYSDGLVVHTTIDSRLQDMANRAVERQGDALQAVAEAEWARSGSPAFSTNPAAYEKQRAGGFAHFWSTHLDLHAEMVRESAPYKQARASGQTDEQAMKAVESDTALMKALREEKTRLQAGFVAMDPRTGQVRAWVGSRKYDDDKFDHVQQARRQPGSTFKPFVYGAAFEQGISPEEMLLDSPVAIQVDERKVWRPTDVGSPTGQPMTLRDGLIHSKNTITAQVMQRVGASRVAGLARAMGVRQSKLDEVPSLALGTSPVTLKEMVSAFGTIANSGGYREPMVVARIDDRNGAPIEHFISPSQETVLSNATAQTLVDVMRGVITQGTAVSLKQRFALGDLDVAGKTGTTQDHTDGWFILMHPELVAGAWIGFNDNRVTMRSDYWGQGAHTALLVVGDFFEQGVKGGRIDRKQRFATPPKPVEQPFLDRMNGWIGSVFPGAPEVAALPDPNVVGSPPGLPPAAQGPGMPPMAGSATAPVAGPGMPPMAGSGMPPMAGQLPPVLQPEPAPLPPSTLAPLPSQAVQAPPVESTRQLEPLQPAPSRQTMVVRRAEVMRAPQPGGLSPEPGAERRPRVMVMPSDGGATSAMGSPRAPLEGAPPIRSEPAEAPPPRPAPVFIPAAPDPLPAQGSTTN